jgi:FkbM family methyltransferase
MALPNLKEQIARTVNARRIGLTFLRNQWFRTPCNIRICGTPANLSYPSEQGVKADFIGCFIRDDYGLLRSARFKPETIVDVGANVGFFSMAARNAFPEATIHAHEPNPRSLPYLQANTSPLHIRVYSESVGSENCAVSIVDRSDCNQATTQKNESGTVNQVDLEQVLNRAGRQIDLLKMDCEGAEWEIFNNAGAVWRNVRELRMEYHLTQAKTYVDVVRKLQVLGFSIHRHVPEMSWGVVWATNDHIL